MRHPHVLGLKHFFEDEVNIYMVLHYCEGGSLYQYIRNLGKGKTIHESQAFIFFFQTCVAVEYLHSKNVIHRDLKPENLLLDANSNIKVSDFGWSALKKNGQEKRKTYCGTIDYMAPEMVKNSRYDSKVDIWSLGVLLYEMTQKKPPFRGSNHAEKYKNILECNIVDYEFEVSLECKDMIQQLLDPDPLKRPSFDQIFIHPFVKMFEKEYPGLNIEKVRSKANKEKFKKRKSAILPKNQNLGKNSLLGRSEMRLNTFKSEMGISVTNPSGKKMEEIFMDDEEEPESAFALPSSQNIEPPKQILESKDPSNILDSGLGSNIKMPESSQLSHKKLERKDSASKKKKDKKKKKKRRKDRDSSRHIGEDLDDLTEMLGVDKDSQFLSQLQNSVIGIKSNHGSKRHLKRKKDSKSKRSISKREEESKVKNDFSSASNFSQKNKFNKKNNKTEARSNIKGTDAETTDLSSRLSQKITRPGVNKNLDFGSRNYNSTKVLKNDSTHPERKYERDSNFKHPPTPKGKGTTSNRRVDQRPEPFEKKRDSRKKDRSRESKGRKESKRDSHKNKKKRPSRPQYKKSLQNHEFPVPGNKDMMSFGGPNVGFSNHLNNSGLNDFEVKNRGKQSTTDRNGFDSTLNESGFKKDLTSRDLRFDTDRTKDGRRNNFDFTNDRSRGGSRGFGRRETDHSERHSNNEDTPRYQKTHLNENKKSNYRNKHGFDDDDDDIFQKLEEETGEQEIKVRDNNNEIRRDWNRPGDNFSKMNNQRGRKTRDGEMNNALDFYESMINPQDEKPKKNYQEEDYFPGIENRNRFDDQRNQDRIGRSGLRAKEKYGMSGQQAQQWMSQRGDPAM